MKITDFLKKFTLINSKFIDDFYSFYDEGKNEYDKTINFPSDMPVLHYIEPKVFELISDVNSQLNQYGLKVYTSDFGSTDAYYELVITKIDHTPKDKQRGW
jgi:hypothetical protein